ncbi:phenylalanine--tRNA ligase subunit beta [Spiroplasma floricola]|uniref:Phenylalanine--tRNA ligase beta subunit n=1 Tax=Spiroplasma floricola 23-6 TaxID=1336749 RepID=A0A2K8SEK9_9MOLU|nr:phenylalanine--tRNA ligase subunit beta [Spiroplasma floricola]AUB31884.1 phenylalanyl-tRNA synthetase subunit beta [Spiroplasma floricola 23-6]
MYLTRKWLEKLIDLNGVKNEQITVALNSLGFEVDSFKDYSSLNDKLKIAHVGNVTPIEGTHLNFCFVDKGDDLVSPIVCGASNVKEGQYVILAEAGKKIANGLKLENREIKGKMSEGMICALTEIGLNEKALSEEEKDWIYPIVTKEDTYTLIGNDTALEEIGFLDAVWEVDLTLNRSDALGALQLAKELANYFDKDLNDFTKNYTFKENSLNSPVSIKIDKEVEKVVRSVAMQVISVKDVLTIGEKEHKIYSNQDIWLKFNDCKTTHNFWMDLANAIAIETGQPILFLDPSKLKSQLEIKNNKNADHSVNLQLLSDKEVISTLGIEINQKYLPTVDSKEILVVYLSLDPIFMRKQQKEFNTSTIDLQRYMKPVSSKLYKIAQDRVIYWLDQYNIYQSNSKLEVMKESNEKQVEVSVKLEYIHKLMGINLTGKEIKSLFKTLDFEITDNGDELLFKVDEFRTDIFHSANIVEEITRIYGYDNVQSTPPKILSDNKTKKLDLRLQKQSENYLLGLGFTNIKTYSLLSSDTVQRWNLFDIKNPINLMSPLSKLRETFRLSLSRSIIETASFNYSKGNKNVKLYEFADIYNMDDLRQRHLAILISGDVINQKSYDLSIKSSYAYLKGICDSILQTTYNLNLNEVEFELNEKAPNDIHPFINAKITSKGKTLGFIYKLNPRFEQSQKLDSTFVLELNITELQEIKNSVIRAQEVSKFQKTTRDVSFILNLKDKYSEIIKTIINKVNHLTKVELIDIYQDEKLRNSNSKSVSVSFEFNSIEKQLTDQEVQKELDKVLSNLSKLKIEVR